MTGTMTFDSPQTQCLAYRLKRASRAINRAYDAALAPYDLKITQFSLLAALASAGPMPITRMADALGLDRTTLSRTFRPLERRGLISVQRDTGRRRLLLLTPAGQSVYADAKTAWAAAQQDAYDRLGPDLWHDLHSLLPAVDRVAR